MAHLAPAHAASMGEAPPNNEAQSPPASLFERQTLTGDWGGLRTQMQDQGIKFGLQEQSELWGNLTGGIRRGATYDGLTTGTLRVDLEKLVGLPGTSFFASAYQIHGRGPSQHLVGNLQLVSNLEATPGTKLYDLWLETAFMGGRLNLRLGQEGANDEFMVTQYGALFINSSFGFPAVTASDLPSGGPNYPLATPFIRLRYDTGGGISLATALFNGDPAPLGPGDPQRRDASGTAFRLNGHALGIAELAFTPPAMLLKGTYKFGAWFHSARFTDPYLDTAGLPLASAASTGVPLQHDHNYGFYAVADQMVWHRGKDADQGIGLFMEIMGAPGDRNGTNLSIEAGLNWNAPFPERENDLAGLAIAWQGISPASRAYSRDLSAQAGTAVYARGETVIEATYLYQIAPWWALQPDAQVVVNPGANIPSVLSTKPLKDAVTLGLRTAITF